MADFLRTCGILALAALVVMAGFRSFWKQGKRGPKPGRPVPRRSVFKARDNEFKTYHRKRSVSEDLAWLEQKRREMLGNPTKAEQRLYETMSASQPSWADPSHSHTIPMQRSSTMAMLAVMHGSSGDGVFGSSATRIPGILLLG